MGDAGILQSADEAAQGGRIDLMLEALRALPIEQFGTVFLSPPSEYPHLGAALPRMASDEIQKNWTGVHGNNLLVQTIDFARELETAFAALTHRKLSDARILDFGCGWGRIMRLMYYYVPPERLYGVDPWDRSLEICRDCHLLGNLALSNWVPLDLPFGNTNFDLIYAFSVFTHLSPKTANIAQATLRQRIAEDGLLTITVRSEDFWPGRQGWSVGRPHTPEEMVVRHQTDGIAFIPHNRPPIDGDITYGDTSISLGYIERNWRYWKISSVKPLAADPLQQLVFLKPRIG